MYVCLLGCLLIITCFMFAVASEGVHCLAMLHVGRYLLLHRDLSTIRPS